MQVCVLMTISWENGVNCSHYTIANVERLNFRIIQHFKKPYVRSESYYTFLIECQIQKLVSINHKSFSKINRSVPYGKKIW